MVKFYYLRVKAHKMTLDEVPERFRESVREMLGNDND